jgi:hypothetical protein
MSAWHPLRTALCVGFVLSACLAACRTDDSGSGGGEGTSGAALSGSSKGPNASTMCPRASREECNTWCSTTAHPHECYDICRKKCPPCRDPSSEWCDKH